MSERNIYAAAQVIANMSLTKVSIMAELTKEIDPPVSKALKDYVLMAPDYNRPLIDLAIDLLSKTSEESEKADD